MVTLAMFLVLLGDGNIGAQCTRHETNDHHNRTYWDAQDSTGKVTVCAEVYKVQLSANDWVAYRMSEVTSPLTDIAHHFPSQADAFAWVGAQPYVVSPQ